MTAVSLKLKYATAAFVAVLLAMAAVTVLLVWQHDSDTRHLGAMAEDTARESLDVELRARASSTAAHAADSITNSIRTRDTVTVARRLLPFIEDPTVAAITVMDSTGTVIYTWHRSVQPQKGVLQAEATEPVRTLVENIPGAATPETFGTVKVLLEQAAPVPETSLTGRLVAASASQSHLALILAGVLALLVGLVGAAIAWRAAHKIERPIDALIKSADRIGQGDYTRPLEVRRRDVLGDLQQALERMRARLRQYTINKSYLHSVLNSMTDAVFVTSPDGVIKLANSAACKLLGFSEEEILGRGIVAVLDERERESFDLTQAAQETRETVVKTRAGQTIPVSLTGSHIESDDPQFQGNIFVARNITDRKRAERRIRYLARYDALTKIPNRMQFHHLLQQTIARALRSGQVVALLYLDMDRFKEVNDTFGHGSGDRAAIVGVRWQAVHEQREFVTGEPTHDGVFRE